jgi:hypothetical protein
MREYHDGSDWELAGPGLDGRLDQSRMNAASDAASFRDDVDYMRRVTQPMTHQRESTGDLPATSP